MAPILEARGITKRFGSIEALRGVSFALRPTEIRALCGENGAGKSTLVKIFTGMHEPDEGCVLVDGREHRIRNPQESQALGIAYVSQELSIAPYLSVFDNVWLGHRAVPLLHRRRSLRRAAQDALDLVGLGHLSLDTTAAALSLGERQLLEIARMLVRDARVLMLDEPTATLSDGEISRVFATLRRLRDNGRTVLFITHRLGEVFEICDSVTVLRNGADVGTHPVSSIGRDELIALMLGRPLGEMYPAAGRASGEAVLAVRNLTVPGSVERLSFELPRGRIMCLAGQLGSGAAEAVRALAGLVYQASGRVAVNGKPMPLGSVPQALARNVRYVSDDRAVEGLFLDLPVDENLVATRLETLGAAGLLSRRRLRATARELAAGVGIDALRLAALARQLSGGNQQKIAIGRSLLTEGEGVLLMSEPTRGVDVGARADIYALMRECCGRGLAVLMSSSDIEEVVGMSDIVITLYRGLQVARYENADIARSKILSDILHQSKPGRQTA
jgi:ABC-type sugar transport system ATPase subunit